MRQPARIAREIIVTGGMVFLAYVLGLLTGAGYAPNHAPDMTFMGLPGYEASGQAGAVYSCATMIALAVAAWVLFRRSARRTVFLTATLLGLAILPYALFSRIDGRPELLPLLYGSGGLAGALVGYALTRLIRPTRGAS